MSVLGWIVFIIVFLFMICFLIDFFEDDGSFRPNERKFFKEQQQKDDKRIAKEVNERKKEESLNVD
jgi:hypothetical protein